MYVNCSSRGYPKKDKFIDEFNFKNWIRLKINTTSKLCIGITDKKRKSIIHAEYFDANNIFSYSFIHNLIHKPNRVHDISRQIKIAL